MTGALTFPPGLHARYSCIQDETGGIRLYLSKGEYPDLKLGDRVQVTGRADDDHGERQIAVSRAEDIIRLGPGVAPATARVSTGLVEEEKEGRLVWIVGRVTAFERYAITLDDGSGPARVYFPDDLPWRRPYVQLGELWAAQGVVGQYAAARPYVGGYRLVVRFTTDVGLPPVFLPVTGADSLAHLSQQIGLKPHLLDLVELDFQPVNVGLFVLEDAIQ